MTDKLSLYKGALRFAEERSIATLTDDVEQRHVLDEIWDAGFIDDVLEMGLWKFAFRTIVIDADTGYTDPLGAGWQRFTLPDDFIKFAQVSTDPNFTEPCLDYQSEGNYIYSYQSTLYIRYVSNDSSFGGDYSLWPGSFENFVEAQLGYEALPRIAGSGSDKKARLEKELDKLRIRAKSECAMRDPTKFPPETAWNRSRRGWRGMRSNRDYSGL
jgi:hypothetical protein